MEVKPITFIPSSNLWHKNSEISLFFVTNFLTGHIDFELTIFP